MNKRTLYFGGAAMFAALNLASAALAQSGAGAPREVEQVVVTGSSIAGVRPVGSATLTVNSEALVRDGIKAPSDLQRVIPQLQVSNVNETSGNNNSRGSAFNLRGIGAQGTLTLVDGRRVVPAGGRRTFQDANIVPLAAVERVEIVTDGNSAIYGADAVAGVVNFILKKNYQGAEVTATYNRQLGGDRWEIAGVGGTTWEVGGRRGNILGTLNYSYREPVNSSASRFLSRNLQPLGGNNAAINGATYLSKAPGTVAIQNGAVYSYFAVNADGRSVTPGGGNASTDYDEGNYLGKERAVRSVIQANQEITEWLSAYGSLIYSDRKVDTRSQQYFNVTVPRTSPFFIPNIPGNTGPTQSVNARGYDTVNKAGVESGSFTGGLRARLPGEWTGDLYSTYGESRDLGNNRVYVSTNALSAQVNAGTINPYNLTPDVLSRISGLQIEDTRNIYTDTLVKFSGPLFNLPAGAVKAAFGAEMSYTKVDSRTLDVNTPTAVSQVGLAAIRSRKVKSLFAELFVPVIGPDDNIPLVQRIDLSGAVRRDDYSDFGSTTNPKVGLTWAMDDQLSIRGSWGTSFRAPTLPDVDNLGGLSIFNTYPNNTGDPRITNYPQLAGRTVVALQLGGLQPGQPSVGPEKATTYSVGFDYRPEWLEGLTVGATYYSIVYRDRIQLASNLFTTMLSSPANRQLYSRFITVAAQPATCINGVPSTYGAAYQEVFKASGYQNVLPVDNCLATAILFGGNVNLGRVEHEGLDTQVSYTWLNSLGRWNAGVSLTKILTLTQQVSDLSPVQDVNGTIGYPSKTKARANFGWSEGPYRATLSANYVGSFFNNLPATVAGVPLQPARVDSWTTFDLNLGYDAPESWGAWANGTSLSITVDNLFDKDPPIALSGTSSAFDSLQGNILGRTYQVQVRKRF